MAQPYAEILDTITTTNKDYELSIIRISEPIRSALQDLSTSTTEQHGDGINILTPATLESDLVHYKELFTKLRFSYLEQVTKEKFIRSIVGDPPLVFSPAENTVLEQSLIGTKASLKAQKIEVENIVAELERQGRQLARKSENITLQTSQLRELPEKIAHLQLSIDELRAAQSPNGNASLTFGLEKTASLTAEREKERAELNRQLEQLQNLIPRKTRELERLENEVQSLEVKRLGTTSAARDAKRRKDEALGGIGDDLEERGKWWRGVDNGLREMLGVEN